MGAILQIAILAMQQLPLAVGTFTSIKHLLSRDPSIPEELQSILADTKIEENTVAARIAKWHLDHPESADAAPAAPTV